MPTSKAAKDVIKILKDNGFKLRSAHGSRFVFNYKKTFLGGRPSLFLGFDQKKTDDTDNVFIILDPHLSYDEPFSDTQDQQKRYNALLEITSYCKAKRLTYSLLSREGDIYVLDEIWNLLRSNAAVGHRFSKNFEDFISQDFDVIDFYFSEFDDGAYYDFSQNSIPRELSEKARIATQGIVRLEEKLLGNIF